MPLGGDRGDFDMDVDDYDDNEQNIWLCTANGNLLCAMKY